MARILSTRAFLRATRGLKPLVGLDVGGRKCGIAISDHFRTSVFPHRQVLLRGHQDDVLKLSQALSTVASEYGAAGLVIGWPLERGGRVGTACQTVLGVVEELEETLDVPMTLWDERFSSKRARDFLQRTHRHSRRRGRGRVAKREDATAAAIILETYVAANEWEVDPLYDDDYDE